jgi:hypothetical protein
MGRPVVSNTTPNGQLVNSDGTATFSLIKWMQSVGTTVNGAFDSSGNYQGPIGSSATINGRSTLASIVANIGTNGIVQPVGLPAATPADQGAVIMPAGAPDNHLGTAAIQPSTAFDLSGAAATAQTNAETFATAAATTAQTDAEAHADAAAAAAQSNAESFASNASNLSSGTVDPARLPGDTVTIITAQLTVGGTQGSMTFVGGNLMSQVQAT